MKAKSKGKYGEQKAVNLFKKIGINCYRNIMSGAYIGEVGDVYFPGYHIVVEVKNRQDITLEKVIKKHKLIYDFLKQLKKEAIKYKMYNNVDPLQLLILGDSSKRLSQIILIPIEFVDNKNVAGIFTDDYICVYPEDLTKAININKYKRQEA